MLSSSSSTRRCCASRISSLARSQAARAAAMSRARSCVSQVNPSPMTWSETRSGKRAKSRASPVSRDADLMNWTTPTGRPWPMCAEHHAERRGGLSLARAGVDDEKAPLVGLRRHDPLARRLALAHFLGVAGVGVAGLGRGLGMRRSLIQGSRCAVSSCPGGGFSSRAARPPRTRPAPRRRRRPGSAAPARRGSGGRAASRAQGRARPRSTPARPGQRRPRARDEARRSRPQRSRPANIRFESHRVRQSTSTTARCRPPHGRRPRRGAAAPRSCASPRRAGRGGRRSALAISSSPAVAGRDINPRAPVRPDQRLGERRLAGPGAAEDERGRDRGQPRCARPWCAQPWCAQPWCAQPWRALKRFCVLLIT